MSDFTFPAAEFKAKSLALIERPWIALRGRGRWTGDPFAPVVQERDIQVLKRSTRQRTRLS